MQLICIHVYKCAVTNISFENSEIIFNLSVINLKFKVETSAPLAYLTVIIWTKCEFIYSFSP